MSRLNLHIGEVTKVLLSPDGRYLISGGADGTIFVMTLSDLSSEPLPTPEPPISSKVTASTSPTKLDLQDFNLLLTPEE